MERGCGLTNRNRMRGCRGRTSGLPTTKSIAIKRHGGISGGLQRRQLNLPQQILDGVATAGALSECDFVERIAAPLPIAVIAWVLAVPRADWGLLWAGPTR